MMQDAFLDERLPRCDWRNSITDHNIGTVGSAVTTGDETAVQLLSTSAGQSSSKSPEDPKLWDQTLI